MLKRTFDIVFALTGILILLPALFVISVLILCDSRGGIFYVQKRVGKGGRDFGLFKFRTMHSGSDRKGLLTIGDNDLRVTKAGYYLRKYKLDELPQLMNVLIGDMSFVGPRPEVRKYVNLYNPEQLKVLSVRPGITDYSSIKFRNESEILRSTENPEEYYLDRIMPEKLELNMKYIQERSFLKDIRIILSTFRSIF